MICQFAKKVFIVLLLLIQDTKALVVMEVFNVEKSYVESLQFLVIVSCIGLKTVWLIITIYFQKYMNPLKNPENSHIIDNLLVDDIFFQVQYNALS